MIKHLLLVLTFFLSFMTTASDLYDFKFESISGQKLVLKSFKDQPILIVNTASMCGFTKQFDGLQKLYNSYKEKGLVIIGMPSNSFKQEYAEEDQVKDFCETRFNINFPMTKIVNVIGEDKHPFYRWLSDSYGVKPKWNFYKFFFNKKGEFVASFSSLTKPSSKKLLQLIEKDINS